MKKEIIAFGLVAILGINFPANAAPHDGRGHGGGVHHRPPHHRMPPPPRHMHHHRHPSFGFSFSHGMMPSYGYYRPYCVSPIGLGPYYYNSYPSFYFGVGF